jgi:hypothetical protein
MVRELRVVSHTVYRCSAAIEMPDVIETRDELVRRFVKAAMSPAPAPVRTMSHHDTFIDGEDELPLIPLTG